MKKILIVFSLLLITASAAGLSRFALNGSITQRACQATTDTINSTICTGDTFYIGTHPYTQAGNYTDTIINAGGCDSVVTLTLSIDQPLISAISISQNTFCGRGNAVSLSAQPAGGVFAGSGVTGSQFNPAVANIGNDTLSYTITDTLGCNATSKRVITVNSSPVVTLYWDSLIGSEGFFDYMGDTVYCHAVSNIVIMRGGNPFGGIYSGPAIINNIFYADSALNYLGITLDTITYTYTDSNGCTGSAINTVGLYNCLGIQSINITGSISIYPNPATDQLFIKTENIQPVSISVYDVDGRMIFTQPFNPEININYLSSGVYIIEVNSKESVVRKRFVKM